ncbi:HIRAN domain-containing protein [Sphingobacterium wenxiniae]|nr:HIRAN domain-containing protein [Sphingobacterium wenxiniae]
MTDFSKIYLAWRKGKGSRRHIVGLLERGADNNVTFQYLPETRNLVKTEGFIPYFEFQDLDKVYDSNVLQIFSHRLIKSERPDIGSFYDFWEIDLSQAQDKFYVLGKTQGLTASDNFEFLAEYIYHPDIHFLTDLSGLSYANLPKGTVKPGDFLQYEFEGDNEFDKEAIKVMFRGRDIGYIKKIHCRIFHRATETPLNLQVKAVEQNGIIRKIFVKISVQG